MGLPVPRTTGLASSLCYPQLTPVSRSALWVEAGVFIYHLFMCATAGRPGFRTDVWVTVSLSPYSVLGVVTVYHNIRVAALC